MHHRGIETARGHRERLSAEAPHEVPVAFPLFVGLYVPLIPGDAEWRVRLLDDEQVELFILRHVAESNVHHLHRSQGFDAHVSVGLVVETAGVDGRAGTHHLERGFVHRKGSCGEQGGHKQRGSNGEQRAPESSVSVHFLLIPFLVSGLLGVSLGLSLCASLCTPSSCPLWPCLQQPSGTIYRMEVLAAPINELVLVKFMLNAPRT